MLEVWEAALLAKLRGSGRLYHATPLGGYVGISATGEISPNRGQLPTTLPQSNDSWSRHLGGISMFDFDTSPIEDLRVHMWDYAPLLSTRARVLVAINPGKLDSELLIRPNEFHTSPLLRGEHPGRRMYVPYLEAIYCTAVSASAFTGFCVGAFVSDTLLWEQVPVSPNATAVVTEIVDGWVKMYPSLGR